MMINGPLPTEVPNLLPSDGAALQTPAEEDGAAFSALILLFLVAPQVQNSVLGVAEQVPAVADGSVSQLLQEIPDAVPAFAPGDGSAVAGCAPSLIETEAALPAQKN